MKFQLTNQAKTAMLLQVVDYLRGKFLKAEQAYGSPIAEIHSEFTDEHGQQWKLSLTRLPPPAAEVVQG